VSTPLENLLQEGVISEIISRLKSGKEADVFLVRQADRVIAAKVYKDHAQRSFKNNATYREGRNVRNSRSQRAIDRGSRFGKEAAEEAWKSAEANTLFKLHAAGVRVPTPVMFLDGVLLMELVLDVDAHPASRLIDTPFEVEQAAPIYRDLRSQLVRMLCCDVIHGDLSPYNVLWGAAGATIIDFPQAVYASQNSNAERFFLRDARNVLDHFAALDRSLEAHARDGSEIWRAYQRRELTPDFVPSGRAGAFDNSARHGSQGGRPAPHHERNGSRQDGFSTADRNGSRQGRPSPQQSQGRSAPQQGRPAQHGRSPQQSQNRPLSQQARPPQQSQGRSAPQQGRPPQRSQNRSAPQQARPPQHDQSRFGRQGGAEHPQGRAAPRQGGPAPVAPRNPARRATREIVVLQKRPLSRDPVAGQGPPVAPADSRAPSAPRSLHVKAHAPAAKRHDQDGERRERAGNAPRKFRK
jgi:RIO kinase 1